MDIYTLDTDFSMLTSGQSEKCILNFKEMAKTAFSSQSVKTKQLAYVLLLQRLWNTYCCGMQKQAAKDSSVGFAELREQYKKEFLLPVSVAAQIVIY